MFGRTYHDLMKEAQTCRLYHTNIVMLHAVVLESHHYGIVMEYVPRGTLDDFLYKNAVRCSVSLS